MPVSTQDQTPKFEAKTSEVSQTIRRYTRDSFFNAGVDSFTQAPAQHPDSFELLTNVMPVSDGPLRRRWGLQSWVDLTSDDVQRLFDYTLDATGNSYVLSADSDSVSAITYTGANLGALQSGFTAAPKVVTSRDYAFMYNGVRAENKKSTISAASVITTTNWGIDRPNGPSTLSPGTMVDDAASGTRVWSNPGNVAASDNVYATVSGTGTPVFSRYLTVSNFGFAIPANATILGIAATVEWKSTDAEYFNNIYIRKAGVILAGQPAATVVATGSPDNITTFGDNQELWGAPWTPADINSATFGFSYQHAFSGAGTHSVDRIQAVVYYTVSISLSATVGGSITLTSGRNYYFIYRNSTTGHLSDLSERSASTGKITAQNQPLTGIIASPDSQVDRKLVLATADGGDPSVLYLLADIPNATTTLTDDIPETTLLTRAVYLYTDSEGIEHGVAGNTPPGKMTHCVKHRGRVYAISGQNIVFTKSQQELITSTGTITGRYEECWPAENFFDIAEGAELPNALFTDGQTLYVGTNKSIRRLYGDGPENFQAPSILFNNLSVICPEAVCPVFLDGAPVGAMWLTRDGRVIVSDFNHYEDVGQSVQDHLNDTDLAATGVVASATYASIQGFDLFLLSIKRRDFGKFVLVYELGAKRWFVWSGFGEGNCLLSINDATNNFGTRIFVGNKTTFKINELSPDLYQDLGVAIPCIVQTGWLDFNFPQVRKLLNEMEITTGDSTLLTTVEGASTVAEFSTPSTVISAAPLITSPLGESKVYLAGSPAKDRFYRLNFTSSANQSNLLNGYSVTFVPVHYN